MKPKTIKHITTSDYVKMGDIDLRQPIPTKTIKNVDPFILLHHYGPYTIGKNSNPFDLEPHPHRGFEPITFLFQGEQLHRDSLGNNEIVKAGDVQWTTAGQGIIHAEGPTKEIVEKGGVLEGIQLWLNLPASKKMMNANYQIAKNENMPFVLSADGLIKTKIVAGKINNTLGNIKTQTEVNVFMIEAKENGKSTFNIPENHNTILYLISGNITVLNETLKQDKNQFIQFNTGGNIIQIKALQNSQLLLLSAEPIHEKVVTYGPFVMNTQSELIDAMNDYQNGKMGTLS